MAAMNKLLTTALTTSTRLKPTRRRIGAAVVFMAMAPTALAKVSSPDWSAFMPKPNCRKSGRRNGGAATPLRERGHPKPQLQEERQQEGRSPAPDAIEESAYHTRKERVHFEQVKIEQRRL